MRKVLSILCFAAVLAFSSCQKDECPKCTVFLVNSELYTYQMTMTGQPAFSLKPAEIKEIEIESGKKYAITGRQNTTFAHNNFSKSVSCDGGCGEMIVEVKN